MTLHIAIRLPQVCSSQRVCLKGEPGPARVVGRPCGSLVFCLCDHICSWEEHKARQGLSSWCLLRSWAYKALRVPVSWSTHPPCCWAFVRERCVWFARGKPVMGRPRGSLVFCLCEHICSREGRKARQGLSNWCLLRSWAYKALRVPVSWSTHSPCCWAFVHERCVWFARGKPVMGRPRGSLVFCLYQSPGKVQK